MSEISVMIVDDHPIVRAGVRGGLAQIAPDIHVVAEAATVAVKLIVAVAPAARLLLRLQVMVPPACAQLKPPELKLAGPVYASPVGSTSTTRMVPAVGAAPPLATVSW